MIIEIEINKKIVEHMIKEQELSRSKCMIDYADMNDLIDEVSQEFLISLLTEYKKHKPTNYLKIKISKK